MARGDVVWHTYIYMVGNIGRGEYDDIWGC